MSEHSQTTVSIVGGGPAGLSAALFTQKNGLDTRVFDADGTWMHKAHLFNYLGVGSADGSAFMETARNQVDSFAERMVEAVVSCDPSARTSDNPTANQGIA